jgi:methionyl-tRNA synthetase
VLATLYRAIAQLAVAVLPIIPDSAARLLNAMGIAPGLRSFAAIQTPWYLALAESDFRLSQPVGLFPRLELPAETT